jgi:hypothetical protein
MKLSRISAPYDAAPNIRADSDRRTVTIEHASEVHTTTEDSKRTVCDCKRLRYPWYSMINRVMASIHRHDVCSRGPLHLRAPLIHAKRRLLTAASLCRLPGLPNTLSRPQPLCTL